MCREKESMIFRTKGSNAVAELKDFSNVSQDQEECL